MIKDSDTGVKYYELDAWGEFIGEPMCCPNCGCTDLEWFESLVNGFKSHITCKKCKRRYELMSKCVFWAGRELKQGKNWNEYKEKE